MKNRNACAELYRGMSLVELMVAMTVGLIVLAAVSTVFVNSKSSYTTQESMARLQESARFAMHFMVRDLRMAGYYGCAGDVKSINSLLNAASGEPYDFTHRIEGSEADSGILTPSNRATGIPAGGTAVASKHPDCPNFVGSKCIGTDVVAVRMVEPASAVSLQSEMPSTAAAAFVNIDHGLEIGDVVMLSDCASAELFQITNISDGSGGNSGKKGIVHNSGVVVPPPGNSTQMFSRTYGPPGGQITKFVNRLYYIGTGTSGHPALFRRPIAAPGAIGEELVEGIENMQVTFGYATDIDRTPRAYYSADAVPNWANVVSARIILKARPTVDSSPTAPASPNEVAPKEFESTVLLRNLQ